jgi:hypothetical protein
MPDQLKADNHCHNCLIPVDDGIIFCTDFCSREFHEFQRRASGVKPAPTEAGTEPTPER